MHNKHAWTKVTAVAAVFAAACFFPTLATDCQKNARSPRRIHFGQAQFAPPVLSTAPGKAGSCIASLSGASLWEASLAVPSQTRKPGTVLVATDFPSIQDALDAAGKRGGGEVLIPAGSFRVTHTLRIPSNVTVTGVGSATVLRATAQIGSRPPFDNRVIRNAHSDRGDSGIVVRDLTIDGGFLGEYHKSGIYGISLENCDNCRIEHVAVRRCSGEGILVAYGGGNVIVEDCLVEENNHGINVHHRSGAVAVRGNICRRNGAHKPQYGGIGIFVEGVHNIVIQDNFCLDNAWAGIVWMGGKDEARNISYPAADCLISGNVCRRNGSQGGIFLNGTYSSIARFLVTSNVCEENGRDGIWALHAADGVISGNLCAGNNRPAAGDKKRPAPADWQKTAAGIRLVSCRRIVVTGNRCTDPHDSKTQVFGICEEGDSDCNIITANILSGNRDDGLHTVGPNTQVSGNVK